MFTDIKLKVMLEDNNGGKSTYGLTISIVDNQINNQTVERESKSLEINVT